MSCSVSQKLQKIQFQLILLTYRFLRDIYEGNLSLQDDDEEQSKLVNTY